MLVFCVFTDTQIFLYIYIYIREINKTINPATGSLSYYYITYTNKNNNTHVKIKENKRFN